MSNRCKVTTGHDWHKANKYQVNSMILHVPYQHLSF